MTITILTFGIAKEITGSSWVVIEVLENSSAGDVKNILEDRYPKLKALTSFALAVNGEYAQGELIIKSGDELAIIPPVSGG